MKNMFAQETPRQRMRDLRRAAFQAYLAKDWPRFYKLCHLHDAIAVTQWNVPE